MTMIFYGNLSTYVQAKLKNDLRASKTKNTIFVLSIDYLPHYLHPQAIDTYSIYVIIFYVKNILNTLYWPI